MQPGIPWDGPLLRETKLSGAFRSTLELARPILDFADQLQQQMPGLAESLACSRLEAWAAHTWGISPTRLRPHLLRRGFNSYREFIDVARPAFVHHWLARPTVIPSAATVIPSAATVIPSAATVIPSAAEESHCAESQIVEDHA
jgi:hypothetical protein